MNDDMLTHYSAALDEVYRLRQALAYEAAVLSAHLDLATFPKSRRRYAEQQIVRMRMAASGWAEATYDEIPDRSIRSAMDSAGMPPTLTRHQWENRDAKEAES